VLEGLGLDRTSEIVYRVILRNRDWGAEQIAAHLDLTSIEARAALTRLLDLGLLRTSVEGTDRMQPVSPAIGFPPLLARAEAELLRRQQALELSRVAVAELLAEFDDTDSPASSDEVERLEGVEAAWACLENVARKAQTSVHCLAASHRAPGLATQSGYDPPIQLTVLVAARGVRVRLVMLHAIRNEPALYQGAQRLAREGVELRTTPAIPVWLFLVDGEYAVVALDPTRNQAGVLRIRTPGVLAALTDLFDRHWREAVPLERARQQTLRDQRNEQEQRLLRLLASGRKDESIARQFGVSTRTVRRMIAELSQKLGAASRFELAVRAIELGLLDQPVRR